MEAERTALIFLNGEHPGPGTLGRLLPVCHTTIAADGGWDVARSLGVTPDILIGDMDSIRGLPPVPDSEGGLPVARVIRHPPAKDWSDTELALRLAWDEGYRRAILFGGGGGRLDHLLAIYALFSRTPAPDRWYTARDEVILIRRKCELGLEEGSVLSLFPLGGGPCRGRSTGLRWPIDRLAWDSGDFGLSNEATATRQIVEVEEGALLLVRSRADGEPLGSMLY